MCFLLNVTFLHVLLFQVFRFSSAYFPQRSPTQSSHGKLHGATNGMAGMINANSLTVEWKTTLEESGGVRHPRLSEAVGFHVESHPENRSVWQPLQAQFGTPTP